MSQKHLGALFGTLDANTTKYLTIGAQLLSRALRSIPAAQVSWPTLQEQVNAANTIFMWTTRSLGLSPLPGRPIGFVDGFFVFSFVFSYAPDDVFEQEIAYNRYGGGCGYQQVIFCGPNGRIWWASVANTGTLANGSYEGREVRMCALRDISCHLSGPLVHRYYLLSLSLFHQDRVQCE